MKRFAREIKETIRNALRENVKEVLRGNKVVVFIYGSRHTITKQEYEEWLRDSPNAVQLVDGLPGTFPGFSYFSKSEREEIMGEIHKERLWKELLES